MDNAPPHAAPMENAQPQPANERRVWSADEDAKIVALVGEHGTRAWTVIAAQLPTRTGKQCRERWHNQLDPNITNPSPKPKPKPKPKPDQAQPARPEHHKDRLERRGRRG